MSRICATIILLTATLAAASAPRLAEAQFLVPTLAVAEVGLLVGGVVHPLSGIEERTSAGWLFVGYLLSYLNINVGIGIAYIVLVPIAAGGGWTGGEKPVVGGYLESPLVSSASCRQPLGFGISSRPSGYTGSPRAAP